MEEGRKKKRWRPSLTAYRALENEVSELREQLRLQTRAEELLTKEKRELEVRLESAGASNCAECVRKFEQSMRDASDTVSMLVRECDAWREQYHALMNRGLIARILNR